jgi:hypothetical protein
MLDFTTGAAPELYTQVHAEREREAENRRWNRRLRELGPMGVDESKRKARGPFGRETAEQRRRRLFTLALDQAQREGITIDAWFAFRYADEDLSARADWAGLLDENGMRRGA